MAKEKLHITEEEYVEKAVLVGLVTREQTEEQLKEYLDELEFLAQTAGAVTEEKFWQKLDRPDKRYYVGSGKLQEINDFVKAYDIDIVIFDDEISPSQQRNIEKELKCKVLDRSMLILDIFAQRAQTVQAKTQVELAQMQYLLPRLRGMWQHLDRVKGGIGMKGAGEKEIETDRRIAQDKISKLKEKLETIDKQNRTQRKNREGMIRVSLVGYTNVGKSTLMKQLSKEDVFAENKLFATLDTTVRKVVLNHVPFLLSDTVGFIRKLPHHLVESFKSTLDEAIESDILLHVVDVAHPNFEDQLNVVNETLQELGASDKLTFLVFNKIDLFRERHFDKHLPKKEEEKILKEFKDTWMAKSNNHAVFIAAETGENIDELKDELFKHIKELYLQRYPYKASYINYYDGSEE
ncbi:MAG: GTPase HflX [Chitinophagales bacterium]|nr:GTPase HflX [Bacteroidota bacterium]MCB9226135.1 GTPase HflX [Chitinophagales bacterium]